MGVLTRSNRALRQALRAEKVTADARTINTLPKLKQLLGQAPLRRSRHWVPSEVVPNLGHAERVRPLLVCASRVAKIAPAFNRAEARELVLSEARRAGADRPLIPLPTLYKALQGPLPAAKRLVAAHGASVPDAAELFGFDAEPPVNRFMYRSGLEGAAANGPGDAALRVRRSPTDWRPAETVRQVARRLGVTGYYRNQMEMVAVNVFGADAKAAGLSVDDAMATLGVESPEARRKLAALLAEPAPAAPAPEAGVPAGLSV